MNLNILPLLSTQDSIFAHLLTFHSSVCCQISKQCSHYFKIINSSTRKSLSRMQSVLVEVGLIFTHRRQYLAFIQTIYITVLCSVSMKQVSTVHTWRQLNKEPVLGSPFHYILSSCISDKSVKSQVLKGWHLLEFNWGLCFFFPLIQYLFLNSQSQRTC